MTPISHEGLLLTLLLLLLGVGGLFIGAEALVRGSSGLALRLGISPLIVGLTVVALGTSSPELFVSVKAALDGNGEISLGNVVGSNICNIGLILGVAALLRPLVIHAQVVRREVPILVAASLLLWLLLAGGVSRIDGLILFGSLIAYLGFSYIAARSEQKPDVAAEFGGAFPRPAGSVLRDLAFIIGGFILLTVGAKLFLDGAVDVAERFGVSHVVIGLTVVAIGTSLPELATSAVAALKKEGDIAVGNAIGSSIFNILCILGIAALVRPIWGTVSVVDLAVMTASAVIIYPMMRTRMRLDRWEGGTLLGLYVLYIFYLIFSIR